MEGTAGAPPGSATEEGPLCPLFLGQMGSWGGEGRGEPLGHMSPRGVWLWFPGMLRLRVTGGKPAPDGSRGGWVGDWYCRVRELWVGCVMPGGARGKGPLYLSPGGHLPCEQPGPSPELSGARRGGWCEAGLCHFYTMPAEGRSQCQARPLPRASCSAGRGRSASLPALPPPPFAAESRQSGWGWVPGSVTGITPPCSPMLLQAGHQGGGGTKSGAWLALAAQPISML